MKYKLNKLLCLLMIAYFFKLFSLVIVCLLVSCLRLDTDEDFSMAIFQEQQNIYFDIYNNPELCNAKPYPNHWFSPEQKDFTTLSNEDRIKLIESAIKLYKNKNGE